MTREPYASADRVFWITDNGSSHRGQASIDRMHDTWPTAHLIHTPVQASWLDQCEIYFCVVQRKVVSPNDFTDLDQIRDRLAAFETTNSGSLDSLNPSLRWGPATTPSPHPSTGDSPTAISTTYSTGPPPTKTPSSTHSPPEPHPRRTCGRDHLGCDP